MLETQRLNRRLKTNLDKDFYVWDPEIKQKVFGRWKEQEERRKQARQQMDKQQEEDTLLDIDLDEVITGKFKPKKVKRAPDSESLF